MHKMTFYPLGCADCCRIDLENGKKLLFDYADMRNPDDKYDLRWDLPKDLRIDLELAKKNYYDVVAFSHLDEDHYKGATNFFWLEHDKKYQDDKRIKIKTLWVPAALITETGPDNDEARIIQREARYRFKEGKGIHVFSRPERLRDWCDKNGMKLEDRMNIISDAGRLAPAFTKEADGVEFFIHSPFAKRLNEREVEDRNNDSLVMQAVFVIQGVETKALLTADVDHTVISAIVEVTRDLKKRPERLEWDILKLPHHCSYTTIGPEKGEDETKPVDQVKWLCETQRQKNGMVVSPSDPIPAKGSKEDKNDYPPHRQAANYYKGVVGEDNFLVTMEFPRKTAPRPIVIKIDGSKATLERTSLSGVAAITSAPAPRAG
ncbi:MAG: ComEC/Rec2 family competence protein [Nitrospirota bacterium]